MYVNGEEAEASFEIRKNHPAKIEIIYTRARKQKQYDLSFRSSLDPLKVRTIAVQYGEHFFGRDDMEDSTTKVLKVSGTCNDSIRLYFPPGGTITSVIMNRQRDTFNKAISYNFYGNPNHITLSPADTGRYYVRFISCHWWNEYYIELR